MKLSFLNECPVGCSLLSNMIAIIIAWKLILKTVYVFKQDLLKEAIWT